MNDQQKYLDEMLKFYSMNKDASVSMAEPIKTEENVRQVSDTNSEVSDEAVSAPRSAPNPEPENTPAQETESMTDEKISEPESKSDMPENNITEREINLPEREVYKQDSSETDFEDRFPLPVIPDFIRNPTPEPVIPERTMNTQPEARRVSDAKPTNERSVPYAEHGFLKVDVRSGENGIPVPGAAVTVIRKVGNNDDIVFTGTTNDSGVIDKIQLPAPRNDMGNSPESFQNYAVYTVSAYSKGFYREESKNVPVFSGITSIQRFNLIPLPFNYDDKGRTIVNENTEPII